MKQSLSGLSMDQGRREHFRLLMEEWDLFCEQAKKEPIFEKVSCLMECNKQPEFLFSKHGSSFVRCPGCGLIYLNPQLTESALAKHFVSSPAWEVWANAVLTSKEQREFDREKYISSLKALKKMIPGVVKLLDVGANSGFFVSLAKDSGFLAQGIEPSLAACKVAKELYDLTLFNGRFEDYTAQEASFDVITFWASLEYNKNPREVLRKALHILKPGGLLLIYISGNANSLVMRMLREKCVGFLFNRLWYFSPASLDKLIMYVKPTLKFIERKSMVPSLDVIASYLDYMDPYEGNSKLFSEDELRMLLDLIEKKDMGYKFLSIYRNEG